MLKSSKIFTASIIGRFIVKSPQPVSVDTVVSILST